MSFKEFKLDPNITKGILACNYEHPTPIQKKAIPPILENRDLLGLAQTGTGKTAAFALPILQRLLCSPSKKEKALILSPTRELAQQIHDNINQLAVSTHIKSAVIYGGVKKQPQIRAIRSGARIIVACPGRLLDLAADNAVKLSDIGVLVLDEADHMFDKGFLPDIRRIIRQLPANRQTLVFSATMPDEIRGLLKQALNHPVTVQIKHTQPVDTVSHTIYHVQKDRRTKLLETIIKSPKMSSTLVFTRTKHKAKSLANRLIRNGFRAASLQGNLSQQKRQKALDGFRNGQFKILVATDIAARGIDVTGISHVINYDLPDTMEAYTHRTGRTGRACHSGQAFTFAGQEDRKMVALIERNLGYKMKQEILPL